MKKLPLFLLAFLATFTSLADNYEKELSNLLNPGLLPAYRTGKVYQMSSYDRTGGNDDGFSGKYSYVRKEGDNLVIADLKGPGVVNRIWTPTAESDTVKFYFDGETTPRISVPFVDLFSGKEKPFVAPLCNTEIGGSYCLLPIAYEKSLKIVFCGKQFRFIQLQYRELTKKEKMPSFTPDVLEKYGDDFRRLNDAWEGKTSQLAVYGERLKSEKVNLTLRQGEAKALFETEKGGRIVGLEIESGKAMQDAYRRVSLIGRWDGMSRDALHLPLHDFFGYAYGEPAMQSWLLGERSGKMYSYLPMPYDKSAYLGLSYDQCGAGCPESLQVSATVYYVDEPRNAEKEGRFFAQSRRSYNLPSGEVYQICDVKGKGHYVGTILQTQGLEDGHTLFFEGDDCATIDGEMRLHGTGSEDYFNGGYYAILDKWDDRVSLPTHGCLGYDLKMSRTGGYRFYFTDKLNFNKSFNLTIEHQPEAATNVKTDYSSVGLFYAENPTFENTEINIEGSVEKVSHKVKMSPQQMAVSLYWMAGAYYDDSAIVFSMNHAEGHWTTTVDVEAIPVARIYLDGMEKGRYKLYVEFDRTEDGVPFSIWQRMQPVSGWISSSSKDGSDRIVYVGEVEVTDELHYMALRKRIKDNIKLRVSNFIFEKIDD